MIQTPPMSHSGVTGSQKTSKILANRSFAYIVFIYAKKNKFLRFCFSRSYYRR